MIKRDCRYIIKRILIGVGICLSLSFINSCDVKASNDIYMGTNQYSSIGSTIFNFNQANLELNLTRNYNNVITNQSLSISTDFKYLIALNGIAGNRSYFGDLYFIDSEVYRYVVGNNSYRLYCKNLPCHFLKLRFNGNTDNNVGYFDTITITSNSTNNPTISGLSNNQNTGNVTNYYVNFDFYNYNNSLLQSSNSPIVIQPQSSTIESLGIVKNKNQEENVITSYTFNPTFTNFNLDNFTYQYKIGNGDWLGIGVNNYTFNININTTVYFRVLKKSDNSVVDSRSITITNIMKYNDNVNDDYNITYTSENRSVHGNQSSPSKLVDTVVVHFEYFPKQSNLKYQYQYVNNGDTLSTWNNMNNNDYDRDLSVNDNGTLYNRILDENDNVLYSSSFTVNSIGMLLNDNDMKWYKALFSKINYGNGISDLFFMPIDLLNVLKGAIESYNISGACNSYDFGQLFGHHLIIPCINIQGLIGQDLYAIIDLIGATCIVLALIHFVIDTYDGIMFMDLQDRKKEKNGGRFL